jgi:hypothetical protein
VTVRGRLARAGEEDRPGPLFDTSPNYLEEWNAHRTRTPFVWTRDPADIIKKSVRAR